MGANSKVKKSLKRRGIGGGTWRAFTAMTSVGSKGGLPDMLALSKSYHALQARGDPSMATVAWVGAAARHVAKMQRPTHRKSSFSTRTRELQRRLQKVERCAIQADIDALSPLQGALHLAERSQVTHTSMADDLAIVRKAWLQRAEEKKQEMKYCMESLATFSAGLGNTHVEKCMEVLPASCARGDVVPVPVATDMICVEFPGTANKEVTNALAFAQSSRLTNVASSLQREWLQRHQEVGHLGKDIPELSSPSTCYALGFCICSEQGRAIHKFRIQVHKALKAVFKSFEAKSQLEQGSVVLQFDRIAAGSWMTQYEGATTLWLHVSLMYWKPYRPTYTVLVQIDKPSTDSEADGVFYLQDIRANETPKLTNNKGAT
eukprot:3803512-Amphidinium_carterae.2